MDRTSALATSGMPSDALAEVARVLRPGGLMGISVDTLDHPAWRKRRAVHAERSFITRYFTRDEVTASLARHGLELLWGRYLYGKPLAPTLLAPRLLRKPSPAHLLLAPLAALSGALLDSNGSGLMFQSVVRRSRPGQDL